jgi:hypothetical protein
VGVLKDRIKQADDAVVTAIQKKTAISAALTQIDAAIRATPE